MPEVRSTVLILTEPADVHSDAVIRELNRRDIPVFRLHTEDFPSEISLSIDIDASSLGGEIVTPYRRIALDGIGCVWYRRPQEPKLAASLAAAAVEFAQVQAEKTLGTLYNVLEVPWVTCGPHDLRIAEVKALQLSQACAAGFAIPPTLITNDAEKAAGFRRSLGGRRCVVKPVAAQIAKRNGSYMAPITQLVPPGQSLDSVALAPLIFQAYIDKQFELRCTVVGREIFAVKIDSQRTENTRIDWRGAWSDPNDPDENHYEVYALPDGVRQRLHRLMDAFRIRFACIDLIVTPDNEYVFLDLNPNGQWLWLEHALGLPIASRLAAMLAAFCRQTAAVG
jgi:hypothetical protein